MEKQLAERLHRVMHEFWRLAFQSNDRIGELSRGEFRLLFCIHKMDQAKDKIATGNLSERLHISKPAISQMMNLLEERELIKRTINRQDRRIMLVSLTEKGQVAIEQGIHLYMTMLENTLAEMGSSDGPEFVELFEKYVDCIKKSKDRMDKDK